VSRPVAIDWNDPVFFDGQPYTFYPVYAGGGVSLYFINGSSDSARVAVAFNRRCKSVSLQESPAQRFPIPPLAARSGGRSGLFFLLSSRTTRAQSRGYRQWDRQASR